MTAQSQQKGTRQTSPLTRRLGAFERLIWLTDQWTPRHATLVARIEGRAVLPDRLSDALCAVQIRHPALRAAIEVNAEGFPQFVPVDSPIELCIVERSIETQWQREVETQLVTPFRIGTGPLVRTTLVRGHSVSELILAAHHSIFDGVSGIFLIRDLLESLEGHRLDELPSRASLEELAVVKTEELEVGATTGGAGQPPSSGESAKLRRPGTPKVSSIELGADELEVLVSRCRAEGTTLQGALLAAALQLLPGGVVRCLAPVNIRRLCPPVEEDFGLYISSGTAILDRESESSFWGAARTARNQIAVALEPQSLSVRARAIAALLQANRSPQSAYEAFRHRVNYGAVVSNLGRFPLLPRVSHFRVTAVYPVLNVEREPVVGVATADGRMSVTLTSDGTTSDRWLRSMFEVLQSQVYQRS